MTTDSAALQRELLELREENAALIEAVSPADQHGAAPQQLARQCAAQPMTAVQQTHFVLTMHGLLALPFLVSSFNYWTRCTAIYVLLQLRLAQRGGADLRGHLSKWNPDAGQQGIFSQDWELRYFVLSGEKDQNNNAVVSE